MSFKYSGFSLLGWARFLRGSSQILVMLLPLAAVNNCMAQGIERCDAKYLATERFALPHLSESDEAASKQLLVQLRSKAGWTREILVPSIVIEGTLTYPSGEKHPIKLYLQGKRHIHFEEISGRGTRIVTANGSVGFIRTSDGTTRPVSIDSVLAEYAFLPFMSDITALPADLRLTGLTSDSDNLNTLQFRLFHLSAGIHDKSAAAADEGSPHSMNRMSGKTTETEIFLDGGTNFPKEIKSCSPFFGNPTASKMVDRTFSAYVTQNGLAYPTHIEQVVGTSQKVSLDITSLATKQNVSSDLWSLSVTQGATR